MRPRRHIAAVLAGLVVTAWGAMAGECSGATFHTDVPEQAGSVVLGRPAKTSITVSLLLRSATEGVMVWGTDGSALPSTGRAVSLKAGEPQAFNLDGLAPDTRYFYELRDAVTHARLLPVSGMGTFHTQRPRGSAYTFTLTADAHLDERTSSDVYDQTLANIRADAPDFHLDLGNLFMTDKQASRDNAARQYAAQRHYLGQIGHSVPVLLALGTHDGESARYNDGSSDCLAVWSNLLRKRYFPNPVPDSFYTGNNQPDPYCGLLQNYYAWEWGDALFVVLDPFRYSVRQRGDGDGWGWSLGQAQYQWLAQTLERSRAKFKFVLIHNLLSGDQAARGGVEVAAFNEWGGKNVDGSDGFKAHRPGWTRPVHALLVRNKVAAVFKAHDNFYARQELDGILYLMVPQPSFAGTDRIRDLETYGYKHGTFLGNSGHVRVTVTPAKVVVDYVKSAPGAPVADSYTFTGK